MKPQISILLTILVVVACEPPASKRSLSYNHWPPKNAKQILSPKTKTLMFQIRSDHPVPIVFKGRHGSTHGHTHGQFMQLQQASSYSQSHGLQRRPRPIKLPSPIYLKTAPMKTMHHHPLKIKLTNHKLNSKPIAANYEKPYKYEKPSTASYIQIDLPTNTEANFQNEHFAPIHTIPAPNLALHDNHIQHEEPKMSSPKPQPYHQLPTTKYYKNYNNNHNNNNNHLEHQYEVLEDITNDATFIDPISESQKLFAPDPDPSLPTSKVRPATEPYNQPSNGKPQPTDVQSNHILPVQIIGAQQAKLTSAEVFPLQFSAQQHHAPFISQHLTAIQAAPISNYDPTYLVTQSNNLYSQHKQQLFQPHISQQVPSQIIETGYANADLTQEVASDGQILQAAKHSYRTEQTNDALPQFAALIAAPAIAAHTSPALAPFHLPNVAAPSTQGGFVISNYYNNGVQDSSQLLNAYAEEEAKAEADLAAAAELRNEQQQQQQQQHYLQQLQEIQAVEQDQFQSQQIVQHPNPKNIDAISSAFEEHQRLVQQQLGSNTPLRIFVPDDDESRLQKRAEKRTDEIKSSQEDIERSQ